MTNALNHNGHEYHVVFEKIDFNGRGPHLYISFVWGGEAVATVEEITANKDYAAYALFVDYCEDYGGDEAFANKVRKYICNLYKWEGRTIEFFTRDRLYL